VIRCVVVATLLFTSLSWQENGRRHHATWSVKEELPVGHVVGNMADVSQGSGRSFSVLAAHSRDIEMEKLINLFTVNSDNGTIQTGQVLDRELLCTRHRSVSSSKAVVLICSFV